MLNYRVAYHHDDARGSDRERERVHKIERLVVKPYRKTDNEQYARNASHDRAVGYHRISGAVVEFEHVEPALRLREYEHQRDHQRNDRHEPRGRSFQKIFIVRRKSGIALFSVSGYQFVVLGTEHYPSDYADEHRAGERYSINGDLRPRLDYAVYRELLDHDHDVRHSYDDERNVESARPPRSYFQRDEHYDHKCDHRADRDQRISERVIRRELDLEVAKYVVVEHIVDDVYHCRKRQCRKYAAYACDRFVVIEQPESAAVLCFSHNNTSPLCYCLFVALKRKPSDRHSVVSMPATSRGAVAKIFAPAFSSTE